MNDILFKINTNSYVRVGEAHVFLKNFCILFFSTILNFIALELFGSATIDSNPVNYVPPTPVYVSMSFQKLFSGDQW